MMTTATDKLIQDGLWQDISEAPRDGARVLLKNDQIPDCSTSMMDDYWYQDRVMGGFDTWDEVFDACDPTHFRSLPDDRLANALKVAVDSLREQIEIWAGSEVGSPAYAQEAYAIRLCKQMYNEASDALAEIERIANGGRGRWIS